MSKKSNGTRHALHYLASIPSSSHRIVRKVEHQHLTYINVLTSDEESRRKPTPAELRMVLDSLVASRAVLLEDGPAIVRKAEGDRRLLLNIEQGEVERVLADVGGPRWKNVLSG